MKGKILDFSIQTNSGAISGDDGERYNFSGADWKSDRHPTRGMSVDFATEDHRAKEIYIAVGGSTLGEKDKILAGLLAIFLGAFGIHKFYLGYKKAGIILLVINTAGLMITVFFLFIPNFIVCVIGVIEGILYLVKSDEEFEQTYVVGKREWF
ncbi:MAG: TM2 domain-containing protein [Candidatus Poribacteria bacterium]|nr:TM2 domain-containing protein [Candidatus Poribacteria bacterium]